jgi:hypothetical protein
MLITHDLIISNQWNKSLWSQNRFIETKFQFGDYVLWFPNMFPNMFPNFRGNGLDPIGYKIICLIMWFTCHH